MASLRDAVSSMEKSVDNLIQRITSVGQTMARPSGRISTGSNFLNNALGSFSTSPGVAYESQFRMGMTAFGGAGRVISGALQMMPEVNATMQRMASYYGSTLLIGGGMSRNQLQQQVLSGLQGGITSPGADQAVASIAAMRGISANTPTFSRLVTGTNYAAQYLGMSNERAATALAGLNTGSMSSRMLRLGIFTGDPRTGETRSQGQIFNDLFNRLTQGRSDMTAEQINDSFYRGVLGPTLRNLGFSEDQQQMFRMFALQKAEGQYMDLSDPGLMQQLMDKAEAEGNENPNLPGYQLNTAKTGAMQNAQEDYLAGIKAVTPVLSTLVDVGGRLADTFGALNSAVGMFAGNPVARGAGEMLGGLGTLGIAGGLGMAATKGGRGLLKKGLTYVSSKLGQSGGGPSGPAMSATSKAVSKVIPGLGTAVMGVEGFREAASGEGFDFSDFAMAVGGGAAIGGIAGGGVFSGPGALLGGVIGGTAYVGGRVLGGLFGEGGGDDGQGAGTMGVGTGQTETFWLQHPTKSARIGARYGATHSIYSGKLVWPNGHKGIDYEGSSGDSIHAAAPGIAHVESGGELGLRVKIEHSNGKYTFYCHLSAVDVKNGQRVERGHVVGRMGSTGGKSTGVHLHFALSKTSTTAGHENPEPYLRGGANYMEPAPTSQEQNAAGNTPAPSGNSVTSAAKGGTDSSATDSTVSASGMEGSAGASNVPAPGANGSSVASTVEPYSAASHYSSGGGASTAPGEGGEGASIEVDYLSGPSGGRVRSKGAGSKVVTNNVTINLSIEKATPDEARKFAEMLKTTLEQEESLKMMARN